MFFPGQKSHHLVLRNKDCPQFMGIIAKQGRVQVIDEGLIANL